MKYMSVRNKFMPMNLQFFAESSEGDDSEDAGGDDPDGDDPDEDGEDDPEEKRYTQKDMDDAVEKRLAREKRKWQRQRSHQKPDAADKSKETHGDTDKDTEASEKARKAEEKAAELELRWTCLEHDVKKTCVDDVLALAKVHVSKDLDLDIEDAIDKVLEKYPHFKDADFSDEEDEPDKKGWGQRHGKAPKKTKTVDDVLKEQLFGK